MPNNDKMIPKPINPTWKDLGFDKNLQRPRTDIGQGQFIGGAQFNAQLSELLFNRMIKLKNLPSATPPQGGDPGKIYWDQDNKKYRIWVSKTVGWADIPYTSTSTTTT